MRGKREPGTGNREPDVELKSQETGHKKQEIRTPGSWSSISGSRFPVLGFLFTVHCLLSTIYYLPHSSSSFPDNSFCPNDRPEWFREQSARCRLNQMKRSRSVRSAAVYRGFAWPRHQERGRNSGRDSSRCGLHLSMRDNKCEVPSGPHSSREGRRFTCTLLWALHKKSANGKHADRI